MSSRLKLGLFLRYREFNQGQRLQLVIGPFSEQTRSLGGKHNQSF
jgi:hypothetical protein